MGGIFDDATIPDCPESEIPEAFNRIVKDRRFDSGHGGYTGTFAEKHNIVRHRAAPFKTEAEAYESICETNDKWGPAEYARIEPEDGKPFWFIGGWCSS